MKENSRYTEIYLQELFILVLRKWWIILICLLVFTGVNGYISYEKLSDVYKAETTIYIGQEKNNDEAINLSTINLNNQLLGDYMEILKSRSVSEEVIKDLKLNMSVSQVKAGIIVSSNPGSRILKISYTDTNPKLAANIANKLCQVIINKTQEVIGLNNIKLIDTALIPKSPIGPNRIKNIAISGAIGIMLGILIIFIIEFSNNTFRNPEDAQKILGISVIGSIPRFDGEKRIVKRTINMN